MALRIPLLIGSMHGCVGTEIGIHTCVLTQCYRQLFFVCFESVSSRNFPTMPIKQPSELLAGSASGLRRPTTSVKDANSATVASLLLQLSTRDTEAGSHVYSRR